MMGDTKPAERAADRVANKPLWKSSTAWTAALGAISFLVYFWPQLAPFVPEEHKKLFGAVGALLFAVADYQGRRTDKRAAQEAAQATRSVAAEVKADVMEAATDAAIAGVIADGIQVVSAPVMVVDEAKKP